MKLLDQYHRQLAQSIRERDGKHVKDIGEQAVRAVPTEQIENEKADAVPEIPKDKSQRRSDSHNAIASRILNRESSSSIADRLASARGIPANPSSRRGMSGSTNIAAQGSETKANALTQKSSTDNREDGVVTTRSPDTKPTISKPAITHDTVQSTAPSQAALPVPSQTSDEPFQRFYSTISPLLNKLTAPLAFAGLPLGFETSSTTESAPPPQPSASSTLSPRRRGTTRNITPPTNTTATTTTANLAASRVTADPDYTPLFSKATLKALREAHDDSHSSGPGGHAYPFGGAESFYVVPTTGGTKSYAGILAHQSQIPGLPSTSTGTTNDLDDEFVDASETPQPPSPQASRFRNPGGRRFGGGAPTAVAPNGKTLEELQLENEMIKRIVNEQSHRIQEFELASQRVMQQNAALRHGIRESQMLVRPPGPGASSLSSSSMPGGSTMPGGAAGGGGGGSSSSSLLLNLPPVPAPTRNRKPDDGNDDGNDDRDDDAILATTGNEAEAKKMEILIQRLQTLETEKRQETEDLKRDNEKLKVVVGRYRERWEKLKEGARKGRRNSSGGGNGGGGNGNGNGGGGNGAGDIPGKDGSSSK